MSDTTPEATIYLLTSINGLLLLVFQDAGGYNFRVTTRSGGVFGRHSSFDSAESAELEGRRVVRAAMGRANSSDFANGG